MVHDDAVRRRRGARRVALAIGFALAAAIAPVAWNRFTRGRQVPVALADQSADLQAALTTRQLEPRGLALSSGGEARAEFAAPQISPEDAQLLFKLTDVLEYDPQTHFRLMANQDLRVPWPDHPGGSWSRVTNADGAREDHDFPAVRPDLFVLVTGDSHTEGVCDNSESFANVVESLLAASHPGRSIEVYNAGVGLYSFYEYLATLQKYLAREPDVFVTAVFGGNDFLEVLKLDNFARRTTPPPRTQGYYVKLERAQLLGPAALAQGMQQMLYLSSYPDQCEHALEAALAVSLEIRRVCAEHGIAWIVVYLPSAFDLPFPEWRTLRAQAAEALSLSETDLQLDNRLGDALLARLRDEGVDVLDLRTGFDASRGGYYWKDLHIDLAAHRRIAELLAPRLEELLRRKR